MTVSVCIIAYNEEKTLTSLFSDIKNQDYPHNKMEVILVNSMSSDRTRVLMEKFAEEENGFLRVKVFDNPKKKQAAGWNIAIKNSSEDIIIRIDAHTMIPREFVSKNVQCIESGEDVSGGPRPNIAEDDSPWKHTLLLAEKSMFGSSIATYRRSHHKTYVKSVFHGAYRREDGVLVDNRQTSKEKPSIIAGKTETIIKAKDFINTSLIGKAGQGIT